MKHRFAKSLAVFCLAAGMSLTLSPVHAEETSQEEDQEEIREIETVQDFVEVFLSWHNVELDEEGNEVPIQDENGEDLEEYTPFTEITEDNYQAVLAGRDVFDTLDEEFQEEILAYIDSEDSGFEMDYDSMCEAARTIQEEIEAALEEEQDEEEDPESQDDPEEEPSGEQEPDLEPETLLDTIQQTVPEAVQPVLTTNTLQSEVPTGSVTAPDSTSQPEETDQQPEEPAVSQETTPEPSTDEPQEQPEPEQPAETPDEGGTDTGDDASDPEEPNDPDPAEGEDQPSETPQDPADSTEESDPEKKEETEESTDENIGGAVSDTAAQTFISTYLMDGQNLILSATSSNYTKILSGLTAWNSMTSSQRLSINSWLKSTAGTTYQSLFSQAQKIRSGAATTTAVTTTTSASTADAVSTAVRNNAGTFAITGAAAAGAAVLILKKMSRKDRH